jgi:hypothetical protein
MKQADFMLTGLKRVVPGVFIDAAVFKRPAHGVLVTEPIEKIDSAVGAGVFIR